VLQVVLDAIGRSSAMPELESSIVRQHRKEHRTDIAAALGAETYLAGEVERSVIEGSDIRPSFLRSGIALTAVAEVPADMRRDVVRFSVVDLICSRGTRATERLLEDVVRAPMRSVEMR
jgi:hypothetical protein